MPMRVTAITHRRNAVVPSYISQVAPSESSVIKRVAYEPLFLAHLRARLGIRGVKRVSLHEPLTGLLRVTIITLEKGTPRTEVWRALHGAAFFKGDCGKITHRGQRRHRSRQRGRAAVGDGLPHESGRGRAAVRIADRATAPSARTSGEEDSTLLIDATMKGDMPPLALPKREYMERAKRHLGRAGPARAAAAVAVVRLLPRRLAAGVGRGGTARRRGLYLENGRISEQHRRKGLVPETKFRPSKKADASSGGSK